MTAPHHTILRGARLPGTAPITVQGIPHRRIVQLSVDGARPVALDPATARALADALVDHAEQAEEAGQ